MDICKIHTKTEKQLSKKIDKSEFTVNSDLS